MRRGFFGTALPAAVLLSLACSCVTAIAPASAETWTTHHVLGPNGPYPFAGIYEFDSLTLADGVEVTSSGISQLVLKVNGTLTLGKGAVIRVRNGYYAGAPTQAISAVTRDNVNTLGTDAGGFRVYEGMFGRGGDGGAGGTGTSSNLNGYGGAGGFGGGAGVGGGEGNGGTGGGPNGAAGGGPTSLGAGAGETAWGGGQGGGGNGGQGGSGGYTNTTYDVGMGGGGGGGGYGGGVLTIIANAITYDAGAPPRFLVSGQFSGQGGPGCAYYEWVEDPGNPDGGYYDLRFAPGGARGSDGQGGLLIIQCSNYAPATTHWSAPTTFGSHTLPSVNGGHGVVAGGPQQVFVLSGDPDLLIKLGSEADSAYREADLRQSEPSGAQIRTYSAMVGDPLRFSVQVRNTGTVAHRFRLRATESAESGWSVIYRQDSTDITSQVTSEAGYQTPELAGMTGSLVVTIEMTADLSVLGNTSKSATLRAYVDQPGAGVSDAVQAVANVASPDLLIAGSGNGVYQATPSGSQVRGQSVAPGVAANYTVTLQNDSATAHSFVLRATETAEPGWSVLYKNGTTDITSQMTTAGGYGTPSLPPGGTLNVVVTATPSAGTAPGAGKSVTINAFMDALDTNVRDSVQATTTCGGLTVTSPNGGETWILGATLPITWNSTGLDGSVKIELSLNGGSTYTPLFSSVANTGSKNWLVAGAMSSHARVRVTAVNAPSVLDSSDADFTIAGRRISGTVTDAGSGVAGATIQVSQGTDIRTTTTDSNGTYAANDLPLGDWLVQVSREGLCFSPASRTVTLGTDQTGVDFARASGGTWTLPQVLGQNGGYPFAGIYEYEGLTLGDGVEVTSSGISHLVIRVHGTLTLGKGATIRVRNGYYPGAPTNAVSLLTASTLNTLGTDAGGFRVYPGMFGKGADGGAGGNFRGGGGGGGGYGGGNGGIGGTGAYAGSPNGGDGGNPENSLGYLPDINFGGPGGGAQDVGGLGATADGNVFGQAGNGGGGGGNSGKGGDGLRGSGNLDPSFEQMPPGDGGGGGGGYGGGILTILADSIVYDASVPPHFLVSGQRGGAAGMGGTGWDNFFEHETHGEDGQPGANGEGGALIIQCPQYASSPAHWTLGAGAFGTHLRASGNGGHGVVTGDPQRVFILAGQTTDRPDLLIKRTDEPNSAFGAPNVYQTSPSGSQIEAQTVAPPATAKYDVMLWNHGNTARRFVLRATESAQKGWTVTYTVGDQNIRGQIAGTGGYTTPSLASGSSLVVHVAMTASTTVPANTRRMSLMKVFVNAQDAQVRDVVGALSTAGTFVQPDLLIKRASETPAAYGLDNVYQAVGSGRQLETQSVSQGVAAQYSVEVQNDGNVARTYVMRAAEVGAPGWSTRYRIGATDITAAITGPAGYTTPSLAAAGGSLVITVAMTPGSTVAGGARRAVLLKAYLDGEDTTPHDAVSAMSVLALLTRGDLLIKRAADPDSAYALDNIYQTVGIGAQNVTQTALPGATVRYHVKVQNDGNAARAFLLRAAASPGSGWTTTYKDGATDITAQITRVQGYATQPIAALGGARILTIAMTPDATVAGGARKSVALKMYLDCSDTVVRDALTATTTAGAVYKPDLLIKAATEPDTAYALNNVTQATPSGDQVAREQVVVGGTVRYCVQVQNDGNAASPFTLRAVESPETGWAVTYKFGQTDITAQMAGAEGYRTPALPGFGRGMVLVVSMTPDSGARLGTRKLATVNVFQNSADTTVRDSVQAASTVLAPPQD